MRYLRLLSALFLVLLLPETAAAQGFVPCSGTDCEMCHLVEMGNSILQWLIVVLSVVAGLIFAFAGLKLVTSGGNPGAKDAAKSMFVNVIVGYLLVLASWLIVDTLMKMLVDDAQVGPWNRVACVGQPEPEEIEWDVGIEHPTPGASRGVAYGVSGMPSGDLTDEQIAQYAQQVANLSADEADALIAQYAAENGISGSTRDIQALMRVESGGCRNNVSRVGALGCMQIMPGTARQYDPSLAGLSDAQVRSRLLNDQEYNIRLGTQIYADLHRRYEGDPVRIHAAYNAGPGALRPSNDCPGLMRWECRWDSPGCHNTGRTDCTPNIGYRETRNYVRKVPEVAAGL